MSGRKWCEKCGELEVMANPFLWIPGGEARAHRAGCPGGRVIPIATICNPPEPTVIDESDLAPGMVVVAVDDWTPGRESVWLMTPDAVLVGVGFSVSERGAPVTMDSHARVRRTAGSLKVTA